MHPRLVRPVALRDHLRQDVAHDEVLDLLPVLARQMLDGHHNIGHAHRGIAAIQHGHLRFSVCAQPGFLRHRGVQRFTDAMRQHHR